MVNVNEKFEKMVEVSQKYCVHGEGNVNKAIDILLNPPEDEWEFREAVRTILNESKRRVHNIRITKEKEKILAHTKIGDLLRPGNEWTAVDRITVCAFYELVNEGYLKLIKVRSKEKDAMTLGRYGNRYKTYSYRVVYERIK